jgi:hypothetical protein
MRILPANAASLALLLVFVFGWSHPASDTNDARLRKQDSQAPSITANTQEKKSLLTLAFNDELPAVDSGTNGASKGQGTDQQAEASKTEFLDAFQRTPECHGLTFKRSKPTDAYFSMQVHCGTEPAPDKCKWDLKATAKDERRSSGSATNVKLVAQSICSTLTSYAEIDGGEVQ